MLADDCVSVRVGVCAAAQEVYYVHLLCMTSQAVVYGVWMFGEVCCVVYDLTRRGVCYFNVVKRDI
jgi:hypothetical protein